MKGAQRYMANVMVPLLGEPTSLCCGNYPKGQWRGSLHTCYIRPLRCGGMNAQVVSMEVGRALGRSCNSVTKGLVDIPKALVNEEETPRTI